MEETTPSIGPERFGMSPASVLEDPRLTAEATRVFSWLAMRARDGSATLGSRLIASKVHMHRSTVQSAIRLLEQCGHLRRSGKDRSRGTYTLTSSIFRASVFGESAGQVVESYARKGVTYKREVVSRPRSAS